MSAEEARDLQGALEQARADFDDCAAVAFLGPTHAGKTVHCALLKDAAAKHLMRHTNGRYVGIATDGSERINRITDALYDGRFPVKTVQGEAVPLTVEITSPKNRTNISLIFHDMAGEEYDGLLVKEMSAEERIRRILDTPKAGDRPYGIMTHLIFAKIYVVVIDSSTSESWGSSESYVKDAIRSIYAIKEHIHDLYRSRMPADIAIVFAKHDTRPGDEDADKLAEGLPEVRAAVEKYVGGDVKSFKSRLDCIEMDSDGVEKMYNTKHRAKLESAETAVRDSQSALDAATQLLNDAKSCLDVEASSYDEAKEHDDTSLTRLCQSAYDKARRAHEEAERTWSSLADKLNRAKSEVEKIRSAAPPARNDSKGPHYGPSKPLSYNTDEYLDMITWLIKMANRSTGH